MRAAADFEDAVAKNPVLESRLYPMRELLGDLLREQGDPGASLAEYDAVMKTMPNRLRTYYGAAKAAEAIGERKKAAWMSAAAPLCGEEMRVEAKAVLAHASGLLGGSEEEFTRAV